MYCSKCGAKQENGAEFCSECGNAIGETKVVKTSDTEEGSTFGWGVLGFFIPLVGLILFLVWRIDRPKASKSAGIGALIGFLGGIILSIISFILAFAFGFGDVLRTNIYF